MKTGRLGKMKKVDTYKMLQPISFEIDREYMLDISYKLKWSKYTHKNGKVIPNYFYAHYHDDQIEGFIDTMPFLRECKWRSSFVKMTESELEWHTDKGAKCAIIWGLQGWQDSCTHFLPHNQVLGNRADHVRKWVYKDALMDTQIRHKVSLGKQGKTIYKISILDKNFTWLYKQWKKHYKGFKIVD